MASQFIGYTVLVTLVSPPNAQLQGVVADVVEKRLILRNGKTQKQSVRKMTDSHSTSFGHQPTFSYLQRRRLSDRRPRSLSTTTRWAALWSFCGGEYAFYGGRASRPATATIIRSSGGSKTTKPIPAVFQGPSHSEFHETYERTERCSFCQEDISPASSLVSCHDRGQREA